MIRACASVGFGQASLANAHVPFRGNQNTSKLRVSLVRHPCDWLEHCYLLLKSGAIDKKLVWGFGDSPLYSFEVFVEDYLHRIPSEVGLIYQRYRADSVIRIEDMPLAFYELLDALGLPRSSMCSVPSIRKPERQIWNSRLRRKACQTEKDVLECYDYIA